MKKLESLKDAKFALAPDDVTVYQTGGVSSYEEFCTHAPDCSVTTDRRLIDICYSL